MATSNKIYPIDMGNSEMVIGSEDITAAEQ
jgi:hypothetical protein